MSARHRFEYFTDRDLGNRFPEILSAAGITVHKHSNYFAADTPDEDWLKVVGQRGWVAITHDARIRYKPNELAAVKRNSVMLLVMVGNAPFPILAKHFVDTVSRIETFLSGHKPPFVAKIYRPTSSELSRDANAPGTIALSYPRKSSADRSRT